MLRSSFWGGKQKESQEAADKPQTLPKNTSVQTQLFRKYLFTDVVRVINLLVTE